MRYFAILILLLLGAFAFAQEAITYKSPNEVIERLNNLNPDELERVKRTIDPEGKLFEQTGFTFSYCKISFKPASIKEFEQFFVYFFDCGGFNHKGISVLTEVKKNNWVLGKMQYFRNVGGGTTFHLEHMTNKSFYDLFVENEIQGHGTGILESDFSIWIWSEGKFVERLRTRQQFHRSGWPGTQNIVQDSVFEISETKSDKSHWLYETQKITTDTSAIVLKRVIDWIPDLKKFRVGDWDEVKVLKKH